MTALRDLKIIIDRIRETVAGKPTARQLAIYHELGEFASEKIRVRTRLGFGVKKSGGTRYTFEGLAPATIKRRERYSGLLSSKTAPARSGLTATGEMTDSIAVRKVTKRGVIIGPSDEKHGKNALSRADITNEELAAIHEKGTRPGVSPKPKKRKSIVSKIKARITRRRKRKRIGRQTDQAKRRKVARKPKQRKKGLPARPFMTLSNAEVAALRNFYRRQFGDLVKRKLS